MPASAAMRRRLLPIARSRAAVARPPCWRSALQPGRRARRRPGTRTSRERRGGSAGSSAADPGRRPRTATAGTGRVGLVGVPLTDVSRALNEPGSRCRIRTAALLSGERLGWVSIRLHPHDQAIAEGEYVGDGRIPESTVGQAAVLMVEDDDVVSPPVGG